MQEYKIRRKKFMNGLILVCAVRGGDFRYGGSFREKLEEQEIRTEAKKLVCKSALNFFKNQKEQTNKFLWRFDTTQLANEMY